MPNVGLVEPTTEPTPLDKILAVAQQLRLSISSVFVPFSQSRNKGEKHPSLNWRVTLRRATHPPTVPERCDVLTTDYMAGCASCPSHKQPPKTGSHLQHEAIKWECELGYPAMILPSGGMVRRPGSKPLQPDLADVLYSLVMDSDVLNYSSFEEWASNFGYSEDSRAAEKVYRLCLEHALAIRVHIGEEGLKKLSEACQEY